MKNSFSNIIKNGKRLASTLLASSFLFVGSSAPISADETEPYPYVQNLIMDLSNDFRNFDKNKKMGLMMTCIFLDGYTKNKGYSSFINKDGSNERACFLEKSGRITMREILERSQKTLDNLHECIETMKLDCRAEYYLLEICFYIGVGYYLYNYPLIARRRFRGMYPFQEEDLFDRGMHLFFGEETSKLLYDFYGTPWVIWMELNRLVTWLVTAQKNKSSFVLMINKD